MRAVNELHNTPGLLSSKTQRRLLPVVEVLVVPNILLRTPAKKPAFSPISRWMSLLTHLVQPRSGDEITTVWFDRPQLVLRPVLKVHVVLVVEVPPFHSVDDTEE